MSPPPSSAATTESSARSTRLFRRDAWRVHAVAFFLLVVMAGFLVNTGLRSAVIIDEPYHMTRGLAYLWMGEGRLSYSHPPVGNVLAALPALSLYPSLDLSEHSAWRASHAHGLSYALAASGYLRFRAAVFRGRLVMAALTLLLGLYLYVWTWSRLGPGGAIFALALYVLHPTLLGRGWMVMTDVPLTVCFVIALTQFSGFLERPGWLPLLRFVVPSALAFCVKYTAFMLIPLTLPAACVAVWRRFGRYDLPTRRAQLRRLLCDVGCTTALCLFAVNAAYRFDDTCLTVGEVTARAEPPIYFLAQYEGDFLERASLLRHLPEGLIVPLPYPYVFGALSIGEQAAGGHDSYLLGRSTSGHWAYFPVLLLFKSTLSIVFILVCGTVYRVRVGHVPSVTWLWLSWCVVMGLALMTRVDLNLGARHALMLFALTPLLAAEIGVLLRDRLAWGRWVLVALVAVAALETYGWSPQHQRYINALAGPWGPYVSVVDEDLGQDATSLAREAAQRGWVPLYYEGFAGHSLRELTDVARVPAQPLPWGEAPSTAGWVAIHRGHLFREKQPERRYPWLRPDQEPVARINGNIFVYRYEGPR